MDDLFKVSSAYVEPHRFYHNLDHIASMIRHFHLWKGKAGIEISDRDAERIYKAIVWHDVIYQIKPKEPGDNERLSAICYEAHSRESKIYDRKVSEMILATADHFSDNEYDPITSFLLDLDLCTFSWEIGNFMEVNRNIDREYITEFPVDEVLDKRASFIENVLQHKARFRVMTDLNPLMKRNIRDLNSVYTDHRDILRFTLLGVDKD